MCPKAGRGALGTELFALDAPVGQAWWAVSGTQAARGSGSIGEYVEVGP